MKCPAAATEKLSVLVVDTAPLLAKCVSLRHLADRLVTTADVIAEVRDVAAREFVASLGASLEVLVPDVASVKAVCALARTSGDHEALSVTDLRVLALAHTLATAAATSPTPSKNLLEAQSSSSSLSSFSPSISLGTAATNEGEHATENCEQDAEKAAGALAQRLAGLTLHCAGPLGFYDPPTNAKRTQVPKADSDIQIQNSAPNPEAQPVECKADGEDPGFEDTWITPENLTDVRMAASMQSDWSTRGNRSRRRPKGSHRAHNQVATLDFLPAQNDCSNQSTMAEPSEADLAVLSTNDLEAPSPPTTSKKQNQTVSWTPAAHVGSSTIGCMTADFAMQNVLMRMKIVVVSLDGLQIKKLKHWLLRCYACYSTTMVMEKRFCPVCGSSTLTRVAYSIENGIQGGKIQLHLKKNYQVPRKLRNGCGIIASFGRTASNMARDNTNGMFLGGANGKSGKNNGSVANNRKLPMLVCEDQKEFEVLNKQHQRERKKLERLQEHATAF